MKMVVYPRLCQYVPWNSCPFLQAHYSNSKVSNLEFKEMQLNFKKLHNGSSRLLNAYVPGTTPNALYTLTYLILITTSRRRYNYCHHFTDEEIKAQIVYIIFLWAKRKDLV